MKRDGRFQVNKAVSRLDLLFLLVTFSFFGNQSSACDLVEHVHKVGTTFVLHVRYGSLPLSGASVDICAESAKDCEFKDLRTDLNGTVKISLKPGRHYMWIDHVGLRSYSTLLVSKGVGANSLTIKWAEYAAPVVHLSGRLVYSGQSERPASGTQIAINDAISGKEVKRFAVDQTAMFDAGELAPGLYSVTFTFGDAAKLVAVQPIKIAASQGAQPEPVLVTLMDTDCGPLATITTDKNAQTY